MVMRRGGQVFLIAAILLAGFLIALTTVANQGVARDEPEAFYDLAEEIDFEVREVLDYGVLQGGNANEFTAQLLNNYSEYIAHEDIVFVYGNSSEVSAIYYQSLTNLQAISLGAIAVPITITIASQTPVIVEPLDTLNSLATIRIRTIDYTFTLRPGQNFYFVLIKEEGGEQFVTVK